MLFDTLKLSCEKLCERDGEFKFQLQSFIKEHISVNGLVNMDTVKSLYDMILEHARSYITVKAETDGANADKIFLPMDASFVEVKNIGKMTVLRLMREKMERDSLASLQVKVYNSNLARARLKVNPKAKKRAKHLQISPQEPLKEEERVARKEVKKELKVERRVRIIRKPGKSMRRRKIRRKKVKDGMVGMEVRKTKLGQNRIQKSMIITRRVITRRIMENTRKYHQKKKLKNQN